VWSALQAINKHLIAAIPAAMAAGFLFGLLFEPNRLAGLLVPLTFLMIYPMMVTLKIRQVLEGGDWQAQLVTQAINFAMVPFVAYALGRLFFPAQPYMALGLLLAGLVPTSGMTISWTGFARGNVAAAVKMTVIGLTLGSLATPLYVQWLLGTSISVDAAAVVRQIALIVFLPMAAGYLTQRTLVRRVGAQAFQALWAPRFPPLSTLGTLGIVFIAIALKARAVAGSPELLLKILAPLVLLYGLNFLVSTVVGRALLPRGDAIAMVYGSVMRNLSIALAVAINAFGPQGSSAALVIAVAYIIQVQSAAWYVRWTPRLFGVPAAEPAPAAGPMPALATTSAYPADMVPKFRKILYATDLSATARHAARYACSLGHHYGAAVTVLHVVPDALSGYSADAGVDLAAQSGMGGREHWNRAEIEAARSRLQARIRETAERVTRQIPSCPVNPENVLVKAGDPVREIVEVAQAGEFDLIVMGTHGHGPLEEAFIGSVATGVIHACRKPVLVVRLPQESAAPEVR
jgi:ACR3 family arsenite efflux pump ArsB/nucleotide-binding universal stress UspA family protein